MMQKAHGITSGLPSAFMDFLVLHAFGQRGVKYARAERDPVHFGGTTASRAGAREMRLLHGRLSSNPTKELHCGHHRDAGAESHICTQEPAEREVQEISNLCGEILFWFESQLNERALDP
jgi:hypothetical protein